MFPQFGATAESLSKASSLVFRIGTDAHLYDDPDDVNIAPSLESRYDSEICEALKRLLAFIAQGFDVSRFFPQVVKNVASQSLEVKKLVYLYLLHYADKRPNEALLSINCFQKDLSDPNPLVRAWALRAMAGIRLHVIAPIVLMAVSKCARDPSVYVRKCAANAIPKLYDLHQEENASTLEEIVNILLSDQSPGVVGAAAAAFICVCPNKLSLLGRNFRRLCETLPDVEEWGQIVLIGILLRYVVARHGLPRESILFSSHSTRGSCSEEDGVDHAASEKDSGNVGGMAYESELTTLLSRCYIEGPDEYLSRSGLTSMDASGLDPANFTSSKNNEDVRILLQSTSPLLWSHNSAVVLAAAGVHWIMTPREDVNRIVKPLLFLLRSSSASKYVVLCNVQVFAKAMPSLFAPHFEDFFISSSDSHQIKSLKLEILSTIATDSSISLIFQEFKDYIKDPDRKFVAATIAAIGLCAQRLPMTANTCLEGLLALTRQESLTSDLCLMDGEACVLAQAIMSIKAIIKQDPASHEKVIIQLARSLDSIKVPAARAMIIWIVGEYNSVGQIIPRILSTVLKYLAWCFTTEALETKHQILSTVVKVVLFAQGEETGTFKTILTYVLELAKYDPNYDIRDRARVLKKLLSCYISSQVLEKGTTCHSHDTYSQNLLVEHIFGGKTKLTSSTPINDRFYLPGSLSQIVLHAAPGYEPLPKPCTLLYDDLGQHTDIVQGIKGSDKGTTNNDSFGMNDPDTLSGSLDEESASSYGSQYSITSSDKSEDSGSASEVDDNNDSLIQLSDACSSHNKPSGIAEEDDSMPFSDELRGLMSKRALESWLNEPSGLSQVSSSIQKVPSNARISLRDIADRVKPKIYTLLDPAISSGLRVDYLFSSEVSTISQLLLCVEIFFENHSTEPLENISLTDEESNQSPESANQASEKHESSSMPSDVPTVIPMEEITSLQPGQMEKKVLQVRFHHHLLPLKLVIWCCGKKHPVKLRPDIGYFVKPLPMEIEAFTCEESKLRGMFEYTRGCTFVDHIEELNHEKDHSALTKDRFLVVCQSLALKMLSNANLFLVSVDMPVAVNLDDASGLCLRFSCEILSNSVPCLITLNVKGKCSEQLNVSVKVNCEETIFGLNLLNRVVAFLS
ncbi:AP3-complex subunit beta-A [Telopea speciosissima]|uniref:AP3-complex subunit beta-A n=1 Tax=Telopea speciosissima TaxID=54955 RepID=UPI001CC7EE10|nr:AP3-complex subunit beta-A [Telopea speciosissima]